MPGLMIEIILIIFIAYTIIITMVALAWRDIKPYQSRNLVKKSVSIIIAARNEEKCISRCLASLLEQKYPHEKIEIIVVDDQSDDQTAAIVRSYSNRGVKLISLMADEGSGKKAALSKGISVALHEIIITTDADCICQPNWVQTMIDFQTEEEGIFIAAPVMFRKENNFLARFQSLDFMALQSVTAVAVTRGWFNMCNGANLLYTKESFHKVGGFEGIDRIPTGDDMLLMEKISAAYPGKVKYCLSKEAIVETEAMPDWKMFLQQRIRWASKSVHYKSIWIRLVLLIVYLMNVSFLVIFFSAFFYPMLWILLLCLLLGKYVLELMIMRRSASFFGKRDLLQWFLIAEPVHIVYTVMAAMLGWMKRYEWKGRAIGR
jgi:biofilm PGA synthesis N-glycosyltransferase PgaC